MPSSSQNAPSRHGGLRSHRDRVRASPARTRGGSWSGARMDTTPDRTNDAADEPDELETADVPRTPDTTDDDGAPVDNPSGG